MCFFSKPKQPQMPVPIQGPPPPAPTPTITPAEVNPLDQQDARRKRLAKQRFGLASTIKTSARGVAGTGVDLSAPVTGKTALGA